MACKPVIGIDLDGTVLDCRPRQQAVTCRLAPEVVPHANALWMLKRDGCSTRGALEKLGLKVPEGFEQHWLELIEHPEYLGLDKLLPGTEAALDILYQTANLHLITSRQNAESVHTTLSRLSILGYFSQIIVVCTGRDAAESKTQHLRATKAIAHCGDTEVDSRSATGAGIPFWGVTSGQRSEAFLRTQTSPARLAPSLHAIAMIGKFW